MADTKKTSAVSKTESKDTKTASAKKDSAPKSAKTTSKKSVKSESDTLMYKGKPLVRCGNVIYYGNPNDKYVAVFRLEDNTALEDIQISGKVIVELKTNDGERSSLIRQAERDGLYKALDVGIYWLEQALEMNG